MTHLKVFLPSYFPTHFEKNNIRKIVILEEATLIIVGSQVAKASKKKKKKSGQLTKQFI